MKWEREERERSKWVKRGGGEGERNWTCEEMERGDWRVGEVKKQTEL